jgi:hypothetical protein
VVGVSLERFYRLGYGLTRDERRAMYEEACEHGRQIAGMLLEGLRERRGARSRAESAASDRELLGPALTDGA